MVLQVFADIRQFVPYGNAGCLQYLSVADSREFKQLWRSDCAGGKDHLAALLKMRDLFGFVSPETDPRNAARIVFFEFKALNMRFRKNFQIASTLCRVEECLGA